SDHPGYFTGLPSLPPDIHPVARPECATKESYQMSSRPPVRQHIDRRPVYVVVLVLQRLFFQTVDKHLEIRLGDAPEEFIRRCVIEINHCAPYPSLRNSGIRAFTSRLTRA